MALVTGIGGFFFRARDPEALARWYFDNLEITLPPRTYQDPAWRQQAGTTIFTAFPMDTDYFSAPDRQWMINFRVSDLDAVVERLRARGNAVEVEPEPYPNGRFARVHDPEGNPIQLWEPGGTDPH